MSFSVLSIKKLLIILIDFLFFKIKAKTNSCTSLEETRQQILAFIDTYRRSECCLPWTESNYLYYIFSIKKLIILIFFFKIKAKAIIYTSRRDQERPKKRKEETRPQILAFMIWQLIWLLSFLKQNQIICLFYSFH